MNDVKERFADGLDIFSDDWCSSNDKAWIISRNKSEANQILENELCRMGGRITLNTVENRSGGPPDTFGRVW